MTQKIQYSDKIQDSILVVGGDNYGEFMEHMGTVLGPEKAEGILGQFQQKGGVTHQQAVQAVANGLGGTPVTYPAAVPQGSATPQCNHGPRVEKRGTSVKGPYHGWLCPQGQHAPDRCEPIWT